VINEIFDELGVCVCVFNCISKWIIPMIYFEFFKAKVLSRCQQNLGEERD
jgi:hypothetical protein